MTLRGPARKLTIVVGESDTWHGKPLSAEIVHRAHAAGLAGASVFRGVEGYGASNHIHTTRIFSLSEDLPMKVEIVDTAEKVDAFVAEIEPLIDEGLITLADVDVVRYAGRRGDPHGADDDAADGTGNDASTPDGTTDDDAAEGR
ncbi:DUF190 domain-containing protein [Phytoactinopolyspora halotolerans]|uniref:DUF190 domain-containing protein n=1 Tax=Phytoactinopolyspora halotolerans TaxID=1981512 RepID=A0A6L9S9K4_9ACTN|nr:DUF190 domain-containing protein [Phytoactinopolyspora halotolerans]NEE01723.1 DUF190 domain-containing protein [Phytoactinopolyspora halotolerans]